MAVQLQLRRGTTAENEGFTGATAEVTVDTDTHELRVHDGSTQGGFVIPTKAETQEKAKCVVTGEHNYISAGADVADNLVALDTQLKSTNDTVGNKADQATTLAGYGITDGANTDLSNLTSTGKNIGNWSSNVSNCITNIPQDIILELDTATHTITLKAGSKVYVPNGFEADGTTPHFDTITITTDLQQTPVGTYSGGSILYVKSDGSVVQQAIDNVSGTTSPTGGMWYDLNTNLIKGYSGGSDTGNRYSLPIATATRTSGNWTSINKIFNGFGCMGSTIFALPNVYGLVPDGKNPDGTLKNIVAHTENVLIYTFANNATANVYMSFKSPDTNGIWTELDFKIDTQIWTGTQTSNWYYNRETNYWSWNGDTSYNWIDCAFINVASGVISSFDHNGYVPNVDINNPRYIAFNAMPSGKYDVLTLGASGTAYTAPANGWFSLGGNDNESGNCRYVMRNNNTRFGVTSNTSNTSTTTGWMAGILPVKKNDQIRIYYQGFTSAGVNFFFFYANGEL